MIKAHVPPQAIPMSPHGLEQPDRADAIGQRELDRIVERGGDLAQAGQVVDLIRSQLVEQVVDRLPRQVELKRSRAGVRYGPLARPIKAVDRLAFAPNELRLLIPVLACDARNQSDPGHAFLVQRR